MAIPLTLRPATLEDADFVRSLLPRFVEFGLPSGRDPGAFLERIERALLSNLEQEDAFSAFWIAEQGGEPLGFLRVERQVEADQDAPMAYISDVAVSESAQGRGVGRALMAAAEAWGRENGCAQVALKVFATNTHARAFYASLGYAEDHLELVKPLG
ncbi:GNAT superfamily N-acetyltransferase [Deinobacterium chartae]|uniref:GNAT superfamily N-acetyltransferase n=1 Tax=Deinobacterium chartae TaxID=521158 RepID=A0A841I4U8_9DEIO|nr:GNAT family N-acetyltransferase [Deinobacterium chartae]MBB6099450.1 GNAT superfamily N-acetyltransferase [Deinobacterium chartae]